MIVVYYSLTGNIPRFLSKCNIGGQSIEVTETVDQPFILVTNTLGFGEVPTPVSRFLARNYKYLTAVAASGNRNWGKNFARAADRIADEYNVPIIHKFELSGTDDDVKIFTERMSAIE
ncbi:class Ib ribonucleoside-diphosphate reductase assembly flavoprotein NrdI [Priestia megaterium]|uniref:class Ib ribonucleoside-diphosphate reductase assembly flavoprotein NrdI n=1 Tax=Priestia megaterium TaxID=1404 RepID=UPI000BFC54D7|nr:class Ib ribonucleoside-diphosphate reductase assembly flavoprotein NrdI [Priestia megaterium]PGN53895.1 class Ib ribonucleoside-diphosphate reductase assembly flavoprotein NrdI [Priestia megaterium]